MSLTLSTPPSASATPSSCSQISFTHFPTSDAACAITSISGLPSNTTSILSSCCKSASVEDFGGNGCGYYCLSIDQSVRDLQTCFMEKGARPADIQCNANNSATATSKPSKTGGSADGAKETGSGEKGGAAGMRKVGLGMVMGMVVVAVAMGAGV